MKLEILPSQFGACIEGLEVKSSSSGDAQMIKNLLHRHQILLFKKQFLTPEQLLSFAAKIGPIIKFIDNSYAHPRVPEIFVVSNMQKSGHDYGMDKVGHYWHSDGSYLAQPQPISVLSAQHVPNFGGETSFIDTRKALQTLDPVIKGELSEKTALHQGKWKYIISKDDLGLSIEEILERDEALYPSPSHPIILVHPFTGDQSLYINQGFTKFINGLDPIKSQKYLGHLFRHIEECPHKYTHHWKIGDLILWDNRSVVHRAYPAAPGEDRMMYRVGINDGPFYLTNAT